jgi:hypothetical protein
MLGWSCRKLYVSSAFRDWQWGQCWVMGLLLSAATLPSLAGRSDLCEGLCRLQQVQQGAAAHSLLLMLDLAVCKYQCVTRVPPCILVASVKALALEVQCCHDRTSQQQMPACKSTSMDGRCTPGQHIGRTQQ